MSNTKQHQIRKKATLHVETLEARVAPAVITEGVAYLFQDGVGGDRISVTLTGPGSAEIVDAAGGDPLFSEIANIYLTGTSNRTVLTITDTDLGVGGDTVRGGVIEIMGGSRAQMGEIVIDAGFGVGTVRNTFMWGGRLNSLTVRADAMRTCGFLFSAATTNRVAVFGDMTGGSFLNITGRANTVVVVGDVEGSTITVGGNAGQLAVGGEVGDSTVRVGGNVNILQLLGGTRDSSVSVTGNVRDTWVAGGMTTTPGDETTLEIGGNVRQFNCFGRITTSQITVGGNVGTFQGACQFMSGAVVDIQGGVTRMDIDGWLNGSVILIGGRTGAFRLSGSVSAGSVIRLGGGCTTCAFDMNFIDSFLVTGGTAKSITVAGATEGSSIVGANFQTLALGGNVLDTSITAHGNARTIQVAGAFGLGAGLESTLLVEGKAGLLDFQSSITGDGDRATREIDVAGMLRQLNIRGSMTDCEVRITGKATNVAIGGNLVDSLVDFQTAVRTIDIRGNVDGSSIAADMLGTLTVGNSMRNFASVSVVNDVGAINVTNSVDATFFWIFGGARTIAVGGSLTGNTNIAVAEELRALSIGGNLGTLGAPDSAVVQAGGLRRADITGLVYGHINVLGQLGDVFTGGQDAGAGLGAPPGGDPPYTGWFGFRTGAGALTGGYVQYVSWGGRTVS